MLPLCRRGSKCHRITTGVAAILSTSSGIPTLVHAGETTTPIEHVVIIIGENRSFDHLFATYVPRLSRHSPWQPSPRETRCSRLMCLS